MYELKKTFDSCTFLHLFNHISEIRVYVHRVMAILNVMCLRTKEPAEVSAVKTILGAIRSGIIY